MARIVTVLGSVTAPGRLSSAVAGAMERAAERGQAASVIDLGQLRLGFADGRPPEQLDDDTGRLVAELSDAEAVILATPIYRATLTGVLKNALDLLPIEALKDKPVGIVSMGATLHHFLGAESHLRDILAWFGALTAPNAVYLSSADFESGVLKENAATRLDDLVAALERLAAIPAAGPIGPTPFAAVRH